METEYQIKYPVWLNGPGESRETRQKQKLIAYSSKCHTPIFGESRRVVPVPVEPLEHISEGAILRDTKPGRGRNKHAPTAKRKGSGGCPSPTRRRPVSCPPCITREIVSPRRKSSTVRFQDDSCLKTSYYIRLLCNVNNVRPISHCKAQNF